MGQKYPIVKEGYVIYKEGETLVGIRIDSDFINLLPPNVNKALKGKRLKPKKTQKK